MIGISRRGFLKGLVGVLSAPAICKAENLMRIVVPTKELIIPDQQLGRGLTNCITHIDESAFISNDYDGDSLNFNIIQGAYTASSRVLSTKYIPGNALVNQQTEERKIREYVNRTSLLKKHLDGKLVFVTRSPDLSSASGVMIKF